MKKPRPSEAFLSEKRARKADLRRYHRSRIWSDGRRSSGTKAPGWVGWPRESYLHAFGRYALDKPAGPRLTVEIPETFSIIEAPERAIQVIGLVARAAGRDDVSEIYFDHRAVKQYDLAAEAILDMVAMDVRSRRRGTRAPLRFTGTFPGDPEADRFIRAIGITHYLDIPGARLKPSVESRLRRFYQSRRTPDPASKVMVSSEKAVVLAQFADQIDACLATVGKHMTARGRSSLLFYTGELIDNIEQHGQSANWYISSYLDPDRTPPLCEVAIFNFSLTFSTPFKTCLKTAFPQ